MTEPPTFDAEPILARYDAGEINDEECLTLLEQAGWTRHRAYVILDQHLAE